MCLATPSPVGPSSMTTLKRAWLPGPVHRDSLAKDTISVLETQCARSPGLPAVIQNGSACSLPFADESMDAVVTDPPYDAMIDYTDASDLYTCG